MQEVILHTVDMFDGYDPEECDYKLWKSIAEYMDGEKALVTASVAEEGEYVFLGLADEGRNKELYWLMEQDGVTGVYGSRSDFEADWESGMYEHDGCFYLGKQYIEFIGDRNGGGNGRTA